MSAKAVGQKRRNNEKRKEKSRVAARCRRNKEVQIFSELSAALPARKEEVEQLDKASVMRLAISYLKVRDVVSLLPDVKAEELKLEPARDLEEVSSEVSYMKALDGFVFVVSQQGDIVYCSENIADHLGVSQMEIMGQSVYEFSHPCDHEDIRDALRETGGGGGGAGGRRELLLRLKCTLTGKGRNVHLKSASYKVIHVTGHMLTKAEEKVAKVNNNEPEGAPKTDGDDGKMIKTGTLIAVGRPIPHPSNIEIPLDSKTFLSKHSLDMKFTYTDDSLQNTLGFKPEELLGHSVYDYHYAGDSAALAQQFKSLFSKGQCETGQYRFLAKAGGYSWVQTQATLITDKHQKPISVVCVNYVVSGIECKDEIFAAHQLQHADLKPQVAPPALTQICDQEFDIPSGAIVAVVPPKEERPRPVTEFIFAPLNKEMNKGYLTFSQNEGTMLKDEPEDLTHLAPTAGDACIPLENNMFDMFDEFILSDNYSSLLGDDLTNGSPVNSYGGDPLLMSSPDTQETDSSCEHSSLLTEISLDAFDSTRSEDLDCEKSPFIPMTDELPLLEPAVMWGALPENVSLARPQPSEPPTPSAAPALQRLLAAPPTGPPPQDLITNIYSDQGLIPNRSISSWDTGIKRVMRQEEEPNAKRVKRSPSPAQPSPPRQSSSVLMNLLDLPQLSTQHASDRPRIKLTPKNVNIGPNYQLIMNAKRLCPQDPVKALSRINTPIPSVNVIPNQPSSQTQVSNDPIRQNLPNKMSPLSLNVDAPMINIRNHSPGLSPAISPVRKCLLASPYSSPRSLSPAVYSPWSNRLSSEGVLHSNSDPYLTSKGQCSPTLNPSPAPTPLDIFDSSAQITSLDFWTEADLIPDTADLLNAFDDVRI